MRVRLYLPCVSCQVRAKRRVPGSVVGDLASVLLCYPCALVQFAVRLLFSPPAQLSLCVNWGSSLVPTLRLITTTDALHAPPVCVCVK